MESGNDERATLFTLIHADERVFIRKPLAYDDALEQASAEFPHLIKESIVFKTKEHPECKGYFSKIAAGAWELVVPDIACVYVDGKRKDGRVTPTPTTPSTRTPINGVTTPGTSKTGVGLSPTTPSRTRPSLGNSTQSSRTRAVSRPTPPTNLNTPSGAAVRSGSAGTTVPVKRRPIPLPSVTSNDE